MKQNNPLYSARKSVLRKLDYFAHLDTSGGIVLILCTIAAMVWANSPWYESYYHLSHIPIGFQFGAFQLEYSLHHWINDGLMVLFFFVVGLEIKREIVVGELSSMKKAALPVLGAVGGMVVPALIFFALNPEGPSSRGWGIPMATDIAFAVGVLTLLGTWVPISLRIFLLALAVIDDLGAVLVIAIFYTAEIHLMSLIASALLLLSVYLMNLAGVRKTSAYAIVGILLWFCVLTSGVHATIAGVLLGLLTPTSAWYLKDLLVDHVREISDQILKSLKAGHDVTGSRLPYETTKYIKKLRYITKESQAPLDRLVQNLHLWVTFLIMPLFAFFNAGVRIEGVSLSALASNSVFLGVGLGLLVGKPLGIILTCYLGVRLGWAQLPKGITWTHIVGVGGLAGIGFTMALFVSGLALGIAPELEVYAKTGILTGSFLAGVIGCIILYRAVHNSPPEPIPVE